MTRMPLRRNGHARLLALAIGVGAATVALGPVSAQSPSPGTVGAPPAVSPAVSPGADASAAPAGSAAPSASPVPGGVTPLPARITGGTCDAPTEDGTIDLQGPIAGGTADDQPDRPIYLSVSTVDGTLDDLVSGDRILVVGGDPGSPESAVACGSLAGPRQSPTDLAVALEELNGSAYQGTALLREGEGTVTVLVVVVTPTQAEIDASPAPSPNGSTAPEESAQPVPTAPSASSVAPRPSVQPGTSGAPPFSPLPQAESPA